MTSAADDLTPDSIARALSIPLWFRLDLELNFIDPRPLRLLADWRAKFRGELPPSREQFEPQNLMEHLGHLIVLETEPEERDFRYRLVGTEIVETVGRDVTGQLVREAYDVRAVQVIRYLADNALPGRIFGRVDWQDKPFLYYETLILPLSSDGRTVDRLLGEMVFPSDLPDLH